MSEKFATVSRWERLRDSFSSLPVAARLYAFGIAMFFVTIAFSLLPVPRVAAGWAIALAMIGVGLGFVCECWGWLVQRMNHPAFKLIAAVLSVMAAAIATGASSTYIAIATSQDPTYFRSTVTFLAPLAFIPVLALTLIFASFLVLPFMFLIGLTRDISRSGGPDLLGLLMIGRLLGFVGFVSALAMILDPSMRVDLGLRTLAAHSAYRLDMQPNSDCASTPGDRVTRINDEMVIVGRITENGPRFNRQLCPLGASVTPLPPPAPRREPETSQQP